MPRGDSGRIVVEIDPGDKGLLYETLDAEGITLREWFIRQMRWYVQDRLQPSLFPEAAGKETRQRRDDGEGNG